MGSHLVGSFATVSTYRLTYKELRTGVSLTTAEAHTITLIAVVDRVRLVGMFFDLNKCFLLPSAMHGIRKIKAQYDEHPNANLLIVGHTDTSGKGDYNLALSLERANAVAAYLTDDVPAWDAYFATSKPTEKRWGLLEVQYMLTALPEGESAYYPSTPTGIDDGVSKAAVKAFQEDRGGLAIDGIAGPLTRKALIEAYMGLDGTTLPSGTSPTTHGCGENFPAEQAGDGVRAPENRRVEVFFFDGPITPPPPGQTSARGSTQYPTWLKQVSKSIDVTLDEGATTTIRILPVFQHDYRYTLRIGDRLYDGEKAGSEPIEHEVSSAAATGELTITDKVDKVPYRWTLSLRALDDLATTAGMQQRLINLGYYDGQPTGTEDDDTRQALRDFQLDSSLEPTGTYDLLTQQALRTKCAAS
jgi:peptidoglycan hydrolase-like protein with peptidoglycan-binding domain